MITDYNDDNGDGGRKLVHEFPRVCQILLDDCLTVAVESFSLFESREYVDDAFETVWGPFPGVTTRDFVTVFLNLLSDGNSGTFEVPDVPRFFEDFHLFGTTFVENLFNHCAEWNEIGLEKFNIQKQEKRYIDFQDWKEMFGSVYNSILSKVFTLTAQACISKVKKLNMTEEVPKTFYAVTLTGVEASFSRIFQPILVPGTLQGNTSESQPVTFITGTERSWLYDVRMNRINIMHSINDEITTFITDFPGIEETEQVRNYLGFSQKRMASEEGV